MSEPRVAAVVVHFGAWAVTRRALRALDRVRGPRLAVLLVDNSGAGERLRSALAGFRRRPRLIPMGRNAGYAPAVNRGIAAALRGGAGFVWLVNNDAEPEPGALAALIAAMRRDPRVGIAGSRTHDDARPPRIWQAGGTVDPRTGLTHNRGAGERDRGQYDRAEDADYVAGCSLLARAAMLRKTGLLDERFVMYYEETDLCLRARAAGWRVRYVPGSRVRHLVAGRETSGDVRWVYWEARNRPLFVLKHFPGRLPAVLIGAWRWPIGSFLLRGRLRGAWNALRGWLAFFPAALTAPRVR